VPPTFDWDDIEDIAIGLTEAHPDTDPLTVRFTDMHKWILELRPPRTRASWKRFKWLGTKSTKIVKIRRYFFGYAF